MPLNHALGIGERAVLLDDRSCWQKEDLGGNGFGVQPFGIRIPEAGALRLKKIPDHQPVEASQSIAMQASIGASRRWFLSAQERSADVALEIVRAHVRP